MSDPTVNDHPPTCSKCYGDWSLNHECPLPGSALFVLNKLEYDKKILSEGQSGADKYDQGKPRMDLLDPYAMEQLAAVLTFGAKKYAAHNWRKGISKSRLIAAALRHIFAYLGGQDKDPETEMSHIAHAMCCCMFLLGLESRADLDDRYVRKED